MLAVASCSKVGLPAPANIAKTYGHEEISIYLLVKSGILLVSELATATASDTVSLATPSVANRGLTRPRYY